MTDNKRLIEKFPREKISPERKVLEMWDEIKECLGGGITRKEIYNQCKKDGRFDFTYSRFAQILRKRIGGDLVGEAVGIVDVKKATSAKIESDISEGDGTVSGDVGNKDVAPEKIGKNKGEEVADEGVVSDERQIVEGDDGDSKDMTPEKIEKKISGGGDGGAVSNTGDIKNKNEGASSDEASSDEDRIVEVGGSDGERLEKTEKNSSKGVADEASDAESIEDNNEGAASDEDQGSGGDALKIITGKKIFGIDDGSVDVDKLLKS